MTNPSSQLVVDALQQLLADQHAAVYGYPVIGIKLVEQAQIDQARALEAAHRLTRDALRDQLTALGVEPVAAQPSYRPSAPVTNPAGAQAWAIELEQRCATGYRYLLSASATAAGSTGAGSSAGAAGSGGVRGQALAGLIEAARQATNWRVVLQPAKPTVAFPGL